MFSLPLNKSSFDKDVGSEQFILNEYLKLFI